MNDDETPNVIESEGRTIDEAVRRALLSTGWSKEDINVEVIRRGGRSLSAGNEAARVRVSRGRDPLQMARQATHDILEHMGLAGEVTVARGADRLEVVVGGDDVESRLTARDGEGIDALQHLVSRIVSRRTGVKQMVSVDAGGFRVRRERELRDRAYRLADEVRQAGNSITTDEYGAAERRVIHLALNEDPDITTFAIGEGLVKRIVIAPIDHAPAQQAASSAGRVSRGPAHGGEARRRRDDRDRHGAGRFDSRRDSTDRDGGRGRGGSGGRRGPAADHRAREERGGGRREGRGDGRREEGREERGEGRGEGRREERGGGRGEGRREERGGGRRGGWREGEGGERDRERRPRSGSGGGRSRGGGEHRRPMRQRQDDRRSGEGEHRGSHRRSDERQGGSRPDSAPERRRERPLRRSW